MTLRTEIRAALARGNLDAMQLLKRCPSAKSIAQITNNLHQLAHAGKILRTSEERSYVLSRRSNRTCEHKKVTKFVVWCLGIWPSGQVKPAQNMPSWLMRANG